MTPKQAAFVKLNVFPIKIQINKLSLYLYGDKAIICAQPFVLSSHCE